MSNWDAKTAEWYASRYGEYATNRMGIDQLTLPKDATVVDIGCGTGSALRHATNQVTEGKLIGIDPIRRMVEIAQEKTAEHKAADQIEYRIGPAEGLPVDDGTADVVIAFDSFDHWEDQIKGLGEVKRILKKNGQFVVVKDGGLPNGSEARTTFVNLLQSTGFTITLEKDITAEQVSFKIWICHQ